MINISCTPIQDALDSEKGYTVTIELGGIGLRVFQNFVFHMTGWRSSHDYAEFVQGCDSVSAEDRW